MVSGKDLSALAEIREIKTIQKERDNFFNKTHRRRKFWIK
jgi:hypothetical protein